MRRQLYGLDLIRFAAALMVTAYHLAYRPWAVAAAELHVRLGAPPVRLPTFWQLDWFGWIGVQVFFVLSGVVIAYSSEGASPAGFFRSRVLRLAPAKWIAATVGAATYFLWHEPLGGVALFWVKSVTFFPFGPWIGGQMWTLGLELSFYSLVLALLCSNRFRYMEALAWGLALTSATYWVARGAGVQDAFPRISQLVLLPHGCFFSLGMTIWMAARVGLNRSRAVLASLCAFTALFQIHQTALDELPGFGLERFAMVPFAVWAMMTALIVLSTLRPPLHDRRSRTKNFIRLLGLATYPLYLLHWHVGGYVLLAGYKAGLSPTLSVGLAAATSVAASLAVAGILEPRLRPLLARSLDWLTRFAPAVSRRPTVAFSAPERQHP